MYIKSNIQHTSHMVYMQHVLLKYSMSCLNFLGWHLYNKNQLRNNDKRKKIVKGQKSYVIENVKIAVGEELFRITILQLFCLDKCFDDLNSFAISQRH